LAYHYLTKAQYCDTPDSYTVVTVFTGAKNRLKNTLKYTL